MSLEKLILHPYNIGNLYPKSLILGKTNLPITEKNNLPKKYLGNNNKMISILLNDNENLHINDDNLAFLTNLLTACKLTINDVAIINLAKQKINFEQLQSQYNCKKLLLFGVATTIIEIPMVFPEYHLHSFKETQILSAHNLTDLQKNIEYKKQIWECLKKMFL